MDRKPKIFFWIAGLYAVLAFSMPAQIMMLYGHTLGEWQAIASKLTVFNWLVIVGLLSCSTLIARGSRYTRIAVPIVIGLVAANNFFVGYLAIDYSMWTATIATLGFVAISIPLAEYDVSKILPAFGKTSRTAERKTVNLPITLIGIPSAQLASETFDISESGLFVRMDEMVHDLEEDQRVSLQLTLPTHTHIQCDARIVRQSEAKGKYPAGLGIQFLDLSHTQRDELKAYLAQF